MKANVIESYRKLKEICELEKITVNRMLEAAKFVAPKVNWNKQIKTREDALALAEWLRKNF